MPNTQHTATDEDNPRYEYDPRYDSQLVPGLGFNGLLVEIGHFLRRIFKRRGM